MANLLKLDQSAKLFVIFLMEQLQQIYDKDLIACTT